MDKEEVARNIAKQTVHSVFLGLENKLIINPDESMLSPREVHDLKKPRSAISATLSAIKLLGDEACPNEKFSDLLRINPSLYQRYLNQVYIIHRDYKIGV